MMLRCDCSHSNDIDCWQTDDFQFGGIACGTGQIFRMTRIVSGMMRLHTFDGQHTAAFAQFWYEHIRFGSYRVPVDGPEHVQRQITVGNRAWQRDVLIHLWWFIGKWKRNDFWWNCGPYGGEQSNETLIWCVRTNRPNWKWYFIRYFVRKDSIHFVDWALDGVTNNEDLGDSFTNISTIRTVVWLWVCVCVCMCVFVCNDLILNTLLYISYMYRRMWDSEKRKRCTKQKILKVNKADNNYKLYMKFNNKTKYDHIR